MRLTTLITGLIMLPMFNSMINAQLFFPFEDNSFNQNKMWVGDTASFKINTDYQLQLNGKASGFSQIFHPLSNVDELFWQFDYKMEFSPSQQNKLRFYLIVDTPDNIQNGYFIEIGETGTKDAIHFYKIQNGISEKLASGIEGTVANSPVEGTINISNIDDKWTCNYRAITTSKYEHQFTISDSIKIPLNHFGIQCQYSATRKDKFYFDNIIIGSLPLDHSPPILDSFIIVDSLQIALFFNEIIKFDTTNITGTIQIIPNHKIESIQSRMPKKLIVILDKPLMSAIRYELQISNISDLVNNFIQPVKINFTYYNIQKAQTFDLVINEIMADPSPANGLPEIEYIEIKNRSSKYLNLNDYTLSDYTKQVQFPSYIIQPNEIVILCDITDTTTLSKYGQTIGIDGMPGLNNSSDDIIILDILGNVIDYIQYDLSWYQSANKAQGGWSLELKHEQRICSPSKNWSASKNINGGTPGTENSFSDTMVSDIALALEFINVIDPYEIEIHFNQSITFEALEFETNISISPELNISNISQDFINKEVVIIAFDQPLEKSQFYHLLFNESIKNCIGEKYTINELDSFALAEFPQKGDLLINEILFNPKEGGSDFIELINISNKVLNLSQIKIGNINQSDSISVYPKIEQHLLPFQILALSTNPKNILNQFNPPLDVHIQKTKLPPWSNESGNASIFQSFFGKTYLLDEFNYQDNFHHPAISDNEGVSLERFDVSAPSHQISNWNSAAESNNFATPGYKNSNVHNNNSKGEKLIFINQKEISPNGDGYEDNLIIYYNLEKANYSIKIDVFDIDGIFIKEITKGEIQGNHGFFVWDGIDFQNKPSNIGVYIILAQLFHSDGTKNSFKLPFIFNLNK